MSNYEPIRIRLEFIKQGDLRYIGHLDLQRLIERAMRRSKLPMRYSQGFNPKVRLNLASALPLGQESKSEFMDLWLEEMVEPSAVVKTLNQALPEGIRVLTANLISGKLPSLQDSLRESVFTVQFQSDTDLSRERLESVLAQEQIIITRRNKIMDMKPLILNWEWLTPELFEIRLSAIPSATGRVDELLVAANIDPATVEIERTELIFKESPDE
ncbi:MAG: TIGR03936 family radical SAM-associated protein [Anaerolineaceae bacterium]